MRRSLHFVVRSPAPTSGSAVALLTPSCRRSVRVPTGVAPSILRGNVRKQENRTVERGAERTFFRVVDHHGVLPTRARQQASWRRERECVRTRARVAWFRGQVMSPPPRHRPTLDDRHEPVQQLVKEAPTDQDRSQPLTNVSSTEEGALVAIADSALRISLANPSLADSIGVPAELEGANLRDLAPDSRTARAVEMLVPGIVSEVVVRTLPDARCLIAEVASVGTERWVLLRVRAAPSRPSAVVTKPLVGRSAETNAFEDFLVHTDSSLFVLEGPLGIGKTALLGAFEARCDALGCLFFKLDARMLEPDDAAIFAALSSDRDARHPLASLLPTARRLASRRWVLAIDNFDAWTTTRAIPKDLFAHLPDECRIVVAVRRRPKPSWWGELGRTVTVCTVAPLGEADTMRLADWLEIAPDMRARAFRRTQGHPLSLVALARQKDDEDVVGIDVLTTATEGRLSREVLKIAALPVRITEDLLVELLEDESLAANAYDVLTEICMPDPENVGLRMPEPLRQLLAERLRQRNPVRFAALHLRLGQYYAKLLEQESTGYARTIDDLLDTLVERPPLRGMFGLAESDVAMRRALPEDVTAIRAFVRGSDPTSTDEIVSRMGADECLTFVSVRPGEVVGVLQFAVVSPHAQPPSAPDRRFAAVRSLLGRYGDRPRRIAAILACTLPQEDSLRWGEVTQAAARQAFALFMTARDVDAFAVVYGQGSPVRGLAGADLLVVDGLRITLRDTRSSTPQAIVATLLASTDESVSRMIKVSATDIPVTVDAVRLALANLDQLEQLATSPLAGLELCRGDDAAAQLRILLEGALAQLRESPRERRLHQILEAVYVEKRGKHEQIASDLGLPYSTFRRHLGRALERIRELLAERVSTGSGRAHT